MKFRCYVYDVLSMRERTNFMLNSETFSGQIKSQKATFSFIAYELKKGLT